MELIPIIKSKFFLIAIAVIVILILLALLSRKSVHTEIHIPEEPHTVWKVLMDEDGYKEWNPVLVPLKGNLEIGAVIHYRWTQANGESIEIDSKVIELHDNKLLHQRGGTPGLLTFDHRYQLYGELGGTRLVQSELYRGIGVLFWDASQMEPQYNKVNQALFHRVLSHRGD